MSAIGTPSTAQAVAEQPGFTAFMGHVAQAFEALGAVVLVIGVRWSLVLAVIARRRSGSAGRGYTALRRAFGGTVLLGLEVLVAADLIRTVAVAPTLDNVLVLGLIVLIRTFLSFSLETEIEGVPPWRRAAASGAGTIRRATQSGLTPARSLTDVPAPGHARGRSGPSALALAHGSIRRCRTELRGGRDNASEGGRRADG